MELLVNDRSLHGQFQDLVSFGHAISRIMGIRGVARRFGRELYCHRGMAFAQITPRMTMPQAVQDLPPDTKRAVMQWLTRQGPFWEDSRSHGSNDYFSCKGEIVTDTAVAEAAWCCWNGVARALVSFAPSDWELPCIPVDWVYSDDCYTRVVDVANHWDAVTVEAVLQAAPPQLTSWDDLQATSVRRCTNLTFAADTFEPLRRTGTPFVPGAAQRILVLLTTLDRFKGCFDDNGQRTAEGQRIYQDHFTGDKAWFSDSSDTEKRDFKDELTFRHPEEEGGRLFCTWHGKVKTPQFRIHFSWPVTADQPLYVVYVGNKITKH